MTPQKVEMLKKLLAVVNEMRGMENNDAGKTVEQLVAEVEWQRAIGKAMDVADAIRAR